MKQSGRDGLSRQPYHVTCNCEPHLIVYSLLLYVIQRYCYYTILRDYVRVRDRRQGIQFLLWQQNNMFDSPRTGNRLQSRSRAGLPVGH